MEQNQQQVVYSERNTSKRAVIRSDGALYVLLLLLTIGLIALTHVLAAKLAVDRVYLQIGLYALLLVIGYAIYRFRLVDYLYELTDREIVVSQTVGSKQKRIVSIPFTAVTEIGAYRKTDAKPAPCAYRGKRSEAAAIWYTEEGERYVLCINASETLKEKLTEGMYAGD